MKAIVFEKYGKPDVLKLVEVATPTPKQDEVLVKVRAAAVNPKDCLVRKGKFKNFTGKKFPQIVGYDFAGTVAAVGKNVSEFEFGEHVFGMINGWRGGTYADFVVAKKSSLCKMPANMSFAKAAALPLVSLTALQALRDEGKIQSGYKVCINGASGGVGTVAIQIAKIIGATVTAVTSKKNIQLVHQLGADATIDYTQRDILETAQNCDIFFDVFGNKSFRNARHILKKNGRFITTVPSMKAIVSSKILTKFSRQKSRLVIVKSNRADLQIIADWAEKNRLKPVIDRVYPLSQAADAHRFVETKRARGKVVLLVGDA